MVQGGSQVKAMLQSSPAKAQQVVVKQTQGTPVLQKVSPAQTVVVSGGQVFAAGQQQVVVGGNQVIATTGGQQVHNFYL